MIKKKNHAEIVYFIIIRIEGEITREGRNIRIGSINMSLTVRLKLNQAKIKR